MDTERSPVWAVVLLVALRSLWSLLVFHPLSPYWEPPRELSLYLPLIVGRALLRPAYLILPLTRQGLFKASLSWLNAFSSSRKALGGGSPLSCSSHWGCLGHLIPHPCWAFCDTLGWNKLRSQRLRLDFSSQFSRWCLGYFLNLRERGRAGELSKWRALFCSAASGRGPQLSCKASHGVFPGLPQQDRWEPFLPGTAYSESQWVRTSSWDFVSLLVPFSARRGTWVEREDGEC